MIVAVQPCDESFLRAPKHAMEVSYWRGADLIELRLDFAEAADWPKVLAALPHAPCHLIVTCRRVRDGGKYAGDEASRLAALRDFAQAGVRYVDIESDVENVDAIADPPGALRSFHNMAETNLEELRAELAKLKEQSAFNVKFATRANSLGDNLIHREILGEMSGLWLKASFGMGMKGMPSRLLQPFWGGGLAYCRIAEPFSPPSHALKIKELLPNLPSLEDLVRTYRMRHWFANKAKLPKLYGLSGAPLALSMSPEIHNGFFARHKVDAFYLPLESEDADEVAAFAKELGLAGLSVTIPLKEKLAEAFGGEAGVFNTVKLGDGEVTFANTDIPAFRADLRFLIDDQKLSQARVLILGAGGAAYAAVEALKNDAGEVLITNRTAARAKALAAKTGVGYHPNPYEDEFGFDVIVNATPCGAKGTPLESAKPIDLAKLHVERPLLVYDMVAGESVWRPERNWAHLIPDGIVARIAHDELELKLRIDGKTNPALALDPPITGMRDGLGMLVKQALLQQCQWGLRPEGLPYNDLRIALVGFRGAGKTTAGHALAAHFGLPFIDLDEAIEERTGKTIAAFFEEFSEAGFRDIEADTLAKALQSKPNYILATGGGIVERAANMRQLYEHSNVLYLQSNPDQLRKNLAGSERPSLHAEGVEGELQEILPRREIRYRGIADQSVGDATTYPLDQLAAWLRRPVLSLSFNLDAMESE